jgi:hypothetical protein
VQVVATPAGIAAQQTMRRRYDEVMAMICADFDDDEVTLLAGLLERLVAGIDSLPASPG